MLLLSGTSVLAQDDNLLKITRINNFQQRMAAIGNAPQSGVALMGVSVSETSEVLGDTYWDKHWGKSSLMLIKGEELIEGYFTRYDLYKDEFEFRLQNNEVRVLPGSKVSNVVWIDSLKATPRFLTNCRNYLEDGVPLTGFIEVILEGKVNLYKKLRLEILKPDFNPALNVGSKDTRILKKELFYYNIDKDLIRIKSRKSLHSLKRGNDKLIDDFIRKQGIKLNNEADLLKLFSFYNFL